MEESAHNPNPGFEHYGYVPARNNSFMIASLIMGILSIITFYSLIGGLIFGGLGILFAILSKGNDRQLSGTAVGGLITSIAGLAFTVILYGFAFFIIFSDGPLHDSFNEIYKDTYGVTIEEYMENPEEFLYPDYSSDYGTL